MNRFRIAKLSFLSSILLAGGIFASEKPSRLSIDADYAAFRYREDTTAAYVEVYYNLIRSQLKFIPDENGYVALIDFKLTLKDTSGAIIDTVSWVAGNRIDKLASLEQSGFLITDMVADIIPFGQYFVSLEITNADRTGRVEFPMEVPAFGQSKPELSTIELAYQISSDSAGRFVKNGIKVLPNPSRDFFRETGPAHFYAEAYSLDTAPEGDSAFRIDLEIIDSEGSTLQTFPPLVYQKPGESAVISTPFNIDSLEAGSYTLKVVLSDGSSSFTRLRNFTVSVPREFTRTSMLQGIMREYPEATAIVTEADAEKFRDEITYIADDNEKRLFESLPLGGKMSFQKDFWSRRDPDPSTPQNEYQIEHYKRFKYVNANFGQFQGAKPGWKSDRGRIYIIYGDPSEMERYPPTSEARGWERWWYHGIEGGVYFIFVDMESAGDYTLIHSSKSGEIKDANWEYKVKFDIEQR